MGRHIGEDLVDHGMTLHFIKCVHYATILEKSNNRVFNSLNSVDVYVRTDYLYNSEQSPLREYWCKWHKCACNLGSHLMFYSQLNSGLENRQTHIAYQRIDIEVVDMSL